MLIVGYSPFILRVLNISDLLQRLTSDDCNCYFGVVKTRHVSTVNGVSECVNNKVCLFELFYCNIIVKVAIQYATLFITLRGINYCPAHGQENL